MRKSGSRAAFDDVGADLIGGDLLEIGPAARIVGEPAFGGLAIPGEMQEFRAFADVLQDADRADRRTLDDLETQIALDGPGTSDRDNDGAPLAEIALMQGETGWRAIGRARSWWLLLDQSAGAVAALPGGESGRRFRGTVRVADNASQRGNRKLYVRTCVCLRVRKRKRGPAETPGPAVSARPITRRPGGGRVPRRRRSPVHGRACRYRRRGRPAARRHRHREPSDPSHHR